MAGLGQLNAEVWVLKLGWSKLPIVPPSCLLDAMRQGGLLIEVVLPIFVISSSR